MHQTLSRSTSNVSRPAVPLLRKLAQMLAFVLLLSIADPAAGASFYWDANGATSGTGGTGNWNTSSSLWRPGSTAGALGTWPASGVDNDAVFAGTVGTVTIAAGGVTANDLTIDTFNYVIQGGPLTLNGGTLPELAVNSHASINANLVAAAGFKKTGIGQLTLRGDNSGLSGTITIDERMIFLFTNDSGSANAAWVLNHSSGDNLAFNTFPANGGAHSVQLGSLSGVAGAILRSAGGQAGTTTFVIGALGTDTAFHGNINNGTGPDLTAITKTGAGELRLTGANGYTGLTTIDNGTLWLDGATHSGSGAYLVNANGTLKGASNISGHAVTVNGTLSPGNGVGAMTTGGNIWSGGGDFLFQINDVDAGAGTGWDLLSIAGALNISALDNSSNQFTINLASRTLGDLAGDVHDFDQFSNYAWLFVDAASPIANFAADKFNVNAGAFLNDISSVYGLGEFSVVLGSAVGGDDSQLYLQYMAAPVPEPSTLLLGLGMAVCCWTIRRRLAPKKAARLN